MKKLLLIVMGLAIFGAITLGSSSVSYAQQGCSVMVKSTDEICVRANGRMPCLQDLTGRTADYYCYNHIMPDDIFIEIERCRVLEKEVPCGPGCVDYIEVDCCCFIPGAAKEAP